MAAGAPRARLGRLRRRRRLRARGKRARHAADAPRGHGGSQSRCGHRQRAPAGTRRRDVDRSLPHRRWRLDQQRSGSNRPRRQRDAIRPDGFALGERCSSQRADGAGNARVHVCRRRARASLRVRHRDGVRPVIARPASLSASIPPGLIRFAPAQRHPSVNGSASAERGPPAGAAVPGDECRRPRRMRRHVPGTPSPAPAEPDPASVMHRRVTPRRRIDPGVAPAADARPVAVAVGSPAGRDVRGEPDVSVIGIALPAAVMIELRVSHHVRRDVLHGSAAFVIAIAVAAPCVEGVTLDCVAHVSAGGFGAGEKHRLTRQRLLNATRKRNLRFAFAHRYRRHRAIGRDVDTVEPDPRQLDLRIGCVDAYRFAGTDRAHAHDDPALGDEQRELPLVEARDVEIGVAAEPELTAAVIDFGAPFAAHPQVVARRDRIVEPDGDPFVRAILGCEKDVAGNSAIRPTRIGKSSSDCASAGIAATKSSVAKPASRSHRRMRSESAVLWATERKPLRNLLVCSKTAGARLRLTFAY